MLKDHEIRQSVAVLRLLRERSRDCKIGSISSKNFSVLAIEKSKNFSVVVHGGIERLKLHVVGR